MLEVVTPTANVKYEASSRLAHPPAIAGGTDRIQVSFVIVVGW